MGKFRVALQNHEFLVVQNQIRPLVELRQHRQSVIQFLGQAPCLGIAVRRFFAKFNQSQYLDGQRDTGTGEALVKRYTLPSEMAARATAKGSGLTPRSRRKAAAARNSAGVADPGFAVPLPATGVDKADEDEDAALGRV